MSNMKITAIVIGVIFVGIIAAAFVVSAPEEDPQSQVEGGELQGTMLEDYETRNDVTELEIIDKEEGSGETVPEGATVTAHYTGALAETGEIFQSSYDRGEPVSFSLNRVVEGWTQGVPGMKVGGTRRLIIPADLAYGANPPPSSNIPPNAPLVFDITIMEVGQ